MHQTTHALLTPGLLQCSEAVWSEQQSRDSFLSCMLAHLDTLDATEHRIAWCGHAEAALWSSPQRPPWRRDRDWANRLVPLVHAKLRKLSNWLDTGQVGPCEALPDLLSSPDNPPLGDALLTLLHLIAHSGLRACVAVNGHAVDEPVSTITCVCACSGGVPRQYLAISDPLDWVRNLDSVDWFWPIEDSDDSWDRFRNGLEILSRALFSGDDRYLQDTVPYHLSGRFRDDLLEAEATDRLPIARSLARRLHMTRQSASTDGSLQDEAVKGDSSEWRFRVSEAARVHYEYRSGVMVFLRYYPSGKHDDGLR